MIGCLFVPVAAQLAANKKRIANRQDRRKGKPLDGITEVRPFGDFYLRL
jgi:hypothetical protein